jgi:hypothetical protein
MMKTSSASRKPIKQYEALRITQVGLCRAERSG